MKKAIAAAAVTVLLGGCGFFSKTKNNYYSLQATPATRTTASVGGTPVGIDGIELPPGLDRRGIVLRGADLKLEVRGNDLWAAPLEDMVAHTLAFNLANRLPEGMVILPGQAKPLGTMRTIYVIFEELAPGPDNVFVLDARWILRTPGTAEVSHHERITVPAGTSKSAEIATAMNTALAMLAEKMVGGLGEAR
jgi:uncharacterized lipoprotein YmbA